MVCGVRDAGRGMRVSSRSITQQNVRRHFVSMNRDKVSKTKA